MVDEAEDELRARGFSLKRPEDKFIAPHKIETRPVEVVITETDEGADVGKGCDHIRFFQKTADLFIDNIHMLNITQQ